MKISLDLNAKAGRKDMFKLTIGNANLQETDDDDNSFFLLLMCWHNSHKANYRDSTGNKKKYIR
jgi:hypothetical protein